MIRVIKPRDISELLKLEKEFFDYKLTTDFFIRVINHKLPYTYYLYTNLGKIKAYLSISIIDGEAEIHSLATVKKYQGKGYMKKLLTKVITILRKNNVKKIFLECRVSNYKAISLYKKNGFLQIGIRPNYYQIEDGLSFVKEL